MALRDRVPVLEISTSGNTSRISGFRAWRVLFRPLTVRFRALTRCFTASAWDSASPARAAFNSFHCTSRPSSKALASFENPETANQRASSSPSDGGKMKRSRDYRRGEKYQIELNCRRNKGMRSISGGIHTFPVDLCECDRLIVRDRLKLIQMFFFYSLSLPDNRSSPDKGSR